MAEGYDFSSERRYRIVRKIDEGGMGAVFEAVSFGTQGFEKVVALKVLRDELSRDPEFINRFVREAKLVADLIHVHIVQIYHFGDFDGRLYIEMEYVHGTDLRALMAAHHDQKVPIPVDLAVYIASRVARGLEYAHRKRDRNGQLLGIVHRDVTPSNVLIAAEGVVKLADFGVAKVVTAGEDEDNMMVGKARYMAPEHADGRPTDPRSDIFSLGIVLWEMLAGRHAIDGESTTDILENLRTRHVPNIRDFRPDVSDRVATILTRALRQHPSERFLHTGLFAEALEQAIYSDGFGPTFVTMAKHLAIFFPHIAAIHTAPEADTTCVAQPVPQTSITKQTLL